MLEAEPHVLDLFKLDGRVAYVTGGGQGLGEAMAKALSQVGSAVAVIDLNLETAKQVASAITEAGGQAIAIQADVTNEAAVERAMDAVFASFGRLDIAINNAGIGITKPLVDTTEEEWRRVIDLDVNAVFLCAKAAGRRLIAQGQGGVMINTASMSGTIVNRGAARVSYCTAKAAVKHMTKALAVEWVSHGIRVNSLSPGHIRTPMIEDYLHDPVKSERFLKYTPMGRVGLPWELAGAIVYLASDASSFMTGTDLIIDGGYTVW